MDDCDVSVCDVSRRAGSSATDELLVLSRLLYFTHHFTVLYVCIWYACIFVCMYLAFLCYQQLLNKDLAYIRFPISLQSQLCVYLAPFPRYELFPKI